MNAIVMTPPARYRPSKRIPLFAKDETAVFISKASAERFVSRIERGGRYKHVSVDPTITLGTRERGFSVKLYDKKTGQTLMAPERWVD